MKRQPVSIADTSSFSGGSVHDLRLFVAGFPWSVNGDLTEELPTVYKDIDIIIKIDGENLDQEKVY